MSDFDCDPLFSRLYLEMLEQMTAYSARRLGDIGLADRPPPAGGLPLSGDRGKDGHDGDPVPGAPVSSEGEAEKI